MTQEVTDQMVDFLLDPEVSEARCLAPLEPLPSTVEQKLICKDCLWDGLQDFVIEFCHKCQSGSNWEPSRKPEVSEAKCLAPLDENKGI